MVSGEYSDIRWEEAETQREAARFGASYLVLFTESIRPGGGLESAFLTRLAAGQPPAWLEMAASNDEALIYRIRLTSTSSRGADTTGSGLRAIVPASTAHVQAPARAPPSPGAPCLATSARSALGLWVPAVASGANVGLADAMARVSPTAATPAAARRSACVAAARGEFEPFQIVIPGGKGLTDVNVMASKLVGPEGTTIPASNVSLFREHPVTLPGHSSYTSCNEKCIHDDAYGNATLGPGTYFDGLVPFTTSTGAPAEGSKIPTTSFSVDPGRNQPIWVEVFVPRGDRQAPPGRYTGTVTVTSAEGSAIVPISLTVWNFELPLRPSLRSLVNISRPENMDRVACLEFLARHKLSPQWSTSRNGPAVAARLSARYGVTSIEPRGYSCLTQGRCTSFQRDAAAYPLDVLLRVYQVDEPPRGNAWWSSNARLQENVRAMHETRIKHLVTIYPQPGLMNDQGNSGNGTRSAVDIWSPGAHDFTARRWDTAFRQAVAKGDEIWPYWGLPSDPYSPRDGIDFPTLNNRQPVGFVSVSAGVQGTLVWQADYWYRDYPRVSVNPWTEPYFYENRDGDTGYGDGLYVMPGDYVGVPGDCFAPTMRLKWLREGIEDYEYARIARDAGVANWLSLVQAAATDFKFWTKNPDVFANARIALARAIHEKLTGARPRATP